MKMDNRLLVEVTVYDYETGEIKQKNIQTYDGNAGYEVRKLFESMGERFSKIIDPYDGY